MGDEDGEIPVRLLIADDHALVRQALRGMLEREPDIEIVGEAVNGREAVNLCRALDPNVVLMDVRMPEMDGLEATRAIKQEHTEVDVLMVTMHDNQDYMLEAAKAGAAGYVLKDASRDELIDAVRGVARRAAADVSPPQPIPAPLLESRSTYLREGGCSGTGVCGAVSLRLPRGLRFLNLLFYLGPETGEGADVDLVVVRLKSLLALPLGAAAAQNGAEVAGQEAQRHRYYGGAPPLEREDRRLAQDDRAQDYEHDGGDEADAHPDDGPGRVEPPPEDRQQDNRHVRARSDRERQSHEKGYVDAFQGQGQCYSAYRDADGRYAGGPELLGIASLAAAEDVGVEVVGEGARGGEHEPCHDGHDGGESDRRDEGEEDRAAEHGGKLRSRQVALRVLCPDGALSNVEGRAVSQDRRYQVEQADDPGRPDDRRAGRLGIRDRKETYQDVWQARRSQDEGDVEREHVEARR